MGYFTELMEKCFSYENDVPFVHDLCSCCKSCDEADFMRTNLICDHCQHDVPFVHGGTSGTKGCSFSQSNFVQRKGAAQAPEDGCGTKEQVEQRDSKEKTEFEIFLNGLSISDRYEFEERAAIFEIEGKFSREEAEVMVLENHKLL